MLAGVHADRLGARALFRTPLSDSRQLLRHLELGEVLGQGCFGVVLAARCRRTGALSAVKVVHTKQSALRGVEREIEILRLVQHPHIIRLERVFHSPTTLYLVFERCSAELGQLLRQRHCFSEEEARTVVSRLGSAVSYLHRHDIVHRDLKLENIVVTTNPASAGDRLFIKVTDFGLSAVRQGAGVEGMLHEYCGTLQYMAPEVLDNKRYSQLCDVWSMGVITFLLLSGHLPFATSEAIRRQDPRFDGWPHPVSRAAVDIIRRMLSKNPALRLTAVEVGMHAWIRDSDEKTQTVLDLMRLWGSDQGVSTTSQL